jgi:hypothetical protein
MKVFVMSYSGKIQFARKAVIGFTKVARRAGMMHAITATLSNKRATARNVSGSVGDTL